MILICGSWEITLLTSQKSRPSEYGCVSSTRVSALVTSGQKNQEVLATSDWTSKRQSLVRISARPRWFPGCDTFCRLSFALPRRHPEWQTAWAEVRFLRSAISPTAPVRHLAVWRGAKDQQTWGVLFTPVLTSSSALKPWETNHRKQNWVKTKPVKKKSRNKREVYVCRIVKSISFFFPCVTIQK